MRGSVKCCEWYREGTSGGTDGTGRNAQVGQPCRSQEEEWGKSVFDFIIYELCMINC